MSENNNDANEVIGVKQVNERDFSSIISSTKKGTIGDRILLGEGPLTRRFLAEMYEINATKRSDSGSTNYGSESDGKGPND